MTIQNTYGQQQMPPQGLKNNATKEVLNDEDMKQTTINDHMLINIRRCILFLLLCVLWTGGAAKTTQIDSLSAKDEEILRKWIASNSNEMYKAEYMGGGCIVLGATDYEYETAREEAEWNDYFKRLLKMGFIESTGRGGDSARYLLTAKAYKYFDD